MAIELATAYFSFLPSLAGTAAAAAPGLRALEGQAAASGARSGALMGGALAGGIGKFIPIIGAAIAAIGIADLFSNAIDSASDLNESANAVRVSFGDAAKEVEALSSTAADRLGVSSNDFNTLAVRFASFSRTIAGEGGNVADTLDEITTRGADFASVYNVDVADALTLFQSGLAGETEPLRRFGIDLSAARVQADAYRFGIAEVGEELTEQEKIQARYMSLMEQTEIVAGDRINTEDELANKQRENAAKFEDALAKIGTALLPAATEFANFVGSDENIARLDKMVDLFIKGEPYITGIADAFLTLANIKLSELDAIFQFLDAMEDGKLSVQESIDLLSTVPTELQNLALSLVQFNNAIGNAVIDGTNLVRQGFADIVNFAATVLGIGNKIKYTPIPHINTVLGFTSGGGPARKRFPGQADGGTTIGAGWSWVGENGPELMHMPVGATVVPLGDAGGVGADLRPYIVRLIEAVEAKRIMVADGQVLAETASTGFAQQASLGAA